MGAEISSHFKVVKRKLQYFVTIGTLANKIQKKHPPVIYHCKSFGLTNFLMPHLQFLHHQKIIIEHLLHLITSYLNYI